MNLLVRGAGSIGLRHIKNALALGHMVYASDPNPDALRGAVGLGAYPPGPRIAFDAVIDATPPSQRSPGILPTLYEKPLAETAIRARQLARSANPLSTVGYQLRFLPRIAELKAAVATENISYARLRFSQNLEDWRPGTDWRKGISAHLGILLEASHELDLLRHVVGEWSWVQGWTGKRLGLPAEDIAVALVGLVDGGIVELHLDMIRSGYERSIEIVGSKTYTVSLDDLVSEKTRNQPYLDELSEFIERAQGCVCTKGQFGASLEDGARAVELADAIKRSTTERVIFNGVEAEQFTGRNWL